MTTNYYRNSGNQSGTTWRDKLEIVRTARSQYKQNENIMTAYEKLLVGKDIAEKQNLLESTILAGALQEWHSVCDEAADALAKVEKAKSKEAARWDAGKMTSEMQMINMLVDQTLAPSGLDSDSLPKLQAIYQDAKISGDQHRIRAAAEVFSGLLGHKIGNDFEQRKQANRLAQIANDDARAVRSMPELENANKEAMEAFERANNARAMLFDVDSALGYTRPNGMIGNYDIEKAINSRINNETGESTIIKPKE